MRNKVHLKFLFIIVFFITILYSKTVNIYDLEGKLVRQNFYVNDTLTEFYTFVYDNKTNKIKESQHSFNGAVLFVSTYQYNNKNLCIRKNKYHSDNSLHWYEIFEYNEDNKIIKKVLYSSFNYDHIVENLTTYSHGSNSMRSDFYQVDDQNKLQLKRIEISYYNDKTNLIKKHLYNAKGEITYYRLYLYDQYDQLLKEEKYNARNIKIDTITYIFNTNILNKIKNAKN